MRTYLTFLSCFFLFLNSTFSQITLAPAGDLLVPRWAHESQVLSNGKVLVFGGNNGDLLNPVFYKSSELYDPVTNTWSGSGNMLYERESFASVLLNDGKVLAIGGIDTTCELYDPATGLWSAAASMHNFCNKAIKLNDGRVLAVAGNASEIYDPSSNKWQYVDTLAIPRGRDFSMILLDNGKVLVTGGGGAETKAELFDPATNSWTLLANTLKLGRKDHSSVKLADGKILLMGGDASSNGCEIYNPTNNTFAYTGAIQENLGGNPAILMDNGTVLIYGLGDFFSPTNTKCLQIFNPSTGVWSAAGAFNFVGTNLYTVCKLKNGQIILIGGSATTGNGASKTCLLVNPSEFSACTAPALTLTLNGTSVCYGKTPSVTINGSEAGLTYTAFISGTKASSSTSGPGTLTLNLDASVIQPGTNIVSIAAKKAGCPTFVLHNTATINSNLSITAKPLLDPSGELIVCTDDSIQLSTTSGYPSYYWSNGKTTTQPVLYVKSSSSIASIQVKFVDGTGCTSVASDFVKVYTAVPPKAGPTLYTCDNLTSVPLTGYSPKGGTWSGPGVSANGIFNPFSVGPGTYELTYTLCGQGSKKQVIVKPSIIPAISAHFTKDTICSSTTGVLEIENSKTWLSYTLRNGNTPIGNAQYGNGGKISFSTSSVPNTTTFNVLCSVTNACGTFTSVSYHKIVAMPGIGPKVTVTDPLVCKNGKTFVVIDSSEKDVSYRLKIGTQNIYTPVMGNGGSAKIEVGPLFTAQTYTIAATYKTCYQREFTTKVTVGIQQPLSYFAASGLNVQPGEYISFENHSKNPSGSYKWYFGAKATIDSSSLVLPDSIYYNQPGSYPVSLICTSPLGCKDTLVRTINVFSPDKNDSCAAARGYIGGYSSSFSVALANDKHDNTYLYAQVETIDGQIKTFSKYTDTIQMRAGARNTDFLGNLLTKYNKQGIPQWMVAMTYDTRWADPGNVDVDSAGDVYLTYFHGDYLDSVRFYSVDNRYYSFKPPHAPNSFTSVIVCKYNSLGYFQWVRTFLDYYTCPKTCLRVDPKGFIYAGSERNFCKYNLNGDKLWHLEQGKNGVAMSGVRGIEIDKENNVRVLQAAGIQIQKYDPNGTLLSTTDPPTQVGTSTFLVGSSHLRLDDAGNGYSAGIFSGKLSFAGTTYESNTGPPNKENAFLAAYDLASGKQKWFIQLKLLKSEIRIMGMDFKNGVGLFTGNVYGSGETLQIGNRYFYFQNSGYFSFNFNASGDVYNFNILTSPSPNHLLYSRDLATFNNTDNNTTIGFDFQGSVKYGDFTYPALTPQRTDYIILKGNASCVSTPILTSISIDQPVPVDPYAMKIFPNPASSREQIYISVSSELREETTVSVMDMKGKRIGTFGFSLTTGLNQIPIPMNVLSELNSGVYFIQLHSASATKTVKLMID